MIARRALLKAGLVSGMAATLGGHFLFAQQRAWGAGAAQVGPGPMGGGMMGDGLGGAATRVRCLTGHGIRVPGSW